MGTALRGYGVLKKELLLSTYGKFDHRHFKYADLTKLPDFSRREFLQLFHDGWFVKMTKTPPCDWKLADCISDYIRNQECDV